MNAPDIIYVVRDGERNDALAYSLRSLAHVPHNRVFISGFCPSWVRNVVIVNQRRVRGKFETIEENYRAALFHQEISENAVYFNDDFYVMKSVESIPVMHGGLPAINAYAQEIRLRYAQTIKLLPNNITHPITYELHVPLPINTEQARRAASVAPRGTLLRTWYGNYCGVGGELTMDVKSRFGDVIDGEYLSSSPRVLKSLRSYLDERLPMESPYVRQI